MEEVIEVLCDKKMRVQLKSQIYKTNFRPVALHGTEWWKVTKSFKRKLYAMEMLMAHSSLRSPIETTKQMPTSESSWVSVYGR